MNNRYFDSNIVIVGGGPAGIAAACEAASNGIKPTLIESTPWLGGQIWRGSEQSADTGVSAQHCHAQATKWLDRFKTAGIQVLRKTTVVATVDESTLLLETPQGAASVQWKKLILALGARELFLPFPGWTLPNVVGVGAIQLMIKTGTSFKDKTVVVAGSGPLLLAAGALLRSTGARVVQIVEQSTWSKMVPFGLSLAYLAPSKLFEGAVYQKQLLGVPYKTGCWPIRANGSTRLESVTVTNGHTEWTLPCDFLACGFGLLPNIELAQILGCNIANHSVQVNANQETSIPGIFCAGESTGIGGVDRSLVEGQIAGHAASGNLAKARSLFSARSRTHSFATGLASAFALRPELRSHPAPDTIVCRCEDVTYKELSLFDNWRNAKLATRCGMGACQGRTCGGMSQTLFGWNPESSRPPVLPVKISTLAALGTEEIKNQSVSTDK